MSTRSKRQPVVLTIAGSDSGGGAGIQTDLKTFHALEVFGTSAITCLTAQNPDTVLAVTPAPKGMTVKQIYAVAQAFPLSAAKTGMLFSRSIINEVSDYLSENPIPNLVVDPVAKSTSGSSLLKPTAERALIDLIIPHATVITPNVPEAEMILKEEIRDSDDQIDAARAISRGFGCACVLKGGHLPGNTMLDVLCHRGRVYKFESKRIKAIETHGTGCTLSAALAARLGHGDSVPQAFRRSCRFVQEALKTPIRAGNHYPLGV